jgi:hypothetical protein
MASGDRQVVRFEDFEFNASAGELRRGDATTRLEPQIGGQLRITAHLIRVDGQAHMWAQRFEPTAADTSQLDRQVSEAVAGAVANRLLGS